MIRIDLVRCSLPTSISFASESNLRTPTCRALQSTLCSRSQIARMLTFYTAQAWCHSYQPYGHKGRLRHASQGAWAGVRWGSCLQGLQPLSCMLHWPQVLARMNKNVAHLPSSRNAQMDVQLTCCDSARTHKARLPFSADSVEVLRVSSLVRSRSLQTS